jgi:hypothetical protein
MTESPEPGVFKETITLPDGRYLIYYTFAGEERRDDPSDDELV